MFLLVYHGGFLSCYGSLYYSQFIQNGTSYMSSLQILFWDHNHFIIHAYM